MTRSDADYLRAFYQALAYEEPLAFDDPRRVPIYEHPEIAPTDPIKQLATSIDWSQGASTHLFSGYRGTGKTTELRRLTHVLEQRHMLTFTADIRAYLNLAAPIDISDFLLAFAGSFGDEVGKLLGWSGAGEESYWARFIHFLTETEIEVTEANVDLASLGPVGIKASLRTDLSFRQRLQDHMAQHVGALVADVRDYVTTCVEKLRERCGKQAKVVFILDSIEHISVPRDQHREITNALHTVFILNAPNLRFDQLHVVYTVPPWLKITSPGVGGLYTRWFSLPCIKVRSTQGSPWQPGVNALMQIVAKREPEWSRLLASEAWLHELILHSGGYIRDFMQLLRACLLRADEGPLPLSREAFEYAVADVRNGYGVLSHEDAFWLERVHRTHDIELANEDDLPKLTRYFDNHLVLCYLNGTEWYDCHPLLVERIEATARHARDERDTAGDREP